MALAVLWDMDGTLVDSEPLHEAALVAALRHYGLEPPADFHALVIGRDAPAIHAFCVERLGLRASLAEWLRTKYRTYFDSLDRLPMRPGAVELYRELDAAGVTQAIVSNSDRLVVQANLEAAGLTAPTQVTVARNDVREGKPAPECYLRAAWLLGRAPRECVVVEDSPTGATAGVAAGMRTLFWPQGAGVAPAAAEPVDGVETLGRLLHEAAGR